MDKALKLRAKETFPYLLYETFYLNLIANWEVCSVTEAEKDEFSTALSERYTQVKQLSSSNRELINTWDAVISDLPLDIKSRFEDKQSQLSAL
ncbi:hypothetical protein C161_27378 [Paenibacillus sp. FSL R5-192]|nr:hypothetical protein C161_27378 [Paenibacillus sp. FSL R5-192]